MNSKTKAGICKHCGGQLKEISVFQGQLGRTHEYICTNCKKKIRGIE
jgi:DNA-directed RNA polymerase subunit RPC12/RpoP